MDFSVAKVRERERERQIREKKVCNGGRWLGSYGNSGCTLECHEQSSSRR